MRNITSHTIANALTGSDDNSRAHDHANAWNAAHVYASTKRHAHPGAFADGFCAAIAYAASCPDSVGSASGAGDTDTGGPGAEVDAFADRAAHRIAAAITLTQPHSALTHTLCDDYTEVYNVARDRLRSLAATDTRNRAVDGRGGAGGAS